MKLMHKSGLIVAIAPLIFSITACGGESGQTPNTPGTPGGNPPVSATQNRWNTIKSRGQVICGVSGEIPGFSFVGADGKYSSIDVDICRAIAGIFLTTIVGISAGIARISDNWLVRNITMVYVEIFRNTPLLLQLLFWYFAVFLSFPKAENKISLWGLIGLSQNGLELPWWTLLPEFSALLLGLTFYTGAFIAEIVRGGIQSVPQGQ